MSQICNKISVLMNVDDRALVEDHIIRGSAAFLESFALLSSVWSRHPDLSIPDSKTALLTACDKSLNSLRTAISHYIDVRGIILTRGIDEDASDILANFDYDVFSSALNLSGDEWYSFSQNAQSRNIYGLVNNFIANMQIISELIEQDRHLIENNRMPSSSGFGRIMAKWQEAILYGHFSAQVYSDIERQLKFRRTQAPAVEN